MIMSQKETDIIAKLVRIANNQQKIIQKLAQQADPLVAYLNRAASTAIANSSGHGTVSVNADGSGNYTVQISGSPEDNAVKQNLIDQFYKMIESQKPELVGKVNLLF
jgi:hypothetical protein